MSILALLPNYFYHIIYIIASPKCFIENNGHSTIVSLLNQIEKQLKQAVQCTRSQKQKEGISLFLDPPPTFTHQNSQLSRLMINFNKSDDVTTGVTYRKIPKISPGAYIFQRPFLRGLFLEGLIYGGKFAFQNRLGQPYSWKEIYCFCFVLLCI